jgi:hypothetical protein
MKCPCLHSEAAPICRADTEAMRIPPAERLTRYCLSEHYRRCERFRSFLAKLVTTPERWRSESPAEPRNAPATLNDPKVWR